MWYDSQYHILSKKLLGNVYCLLRGRGCTTFNLTTFLLQAGVTIDVKMWRFKCDDFDMVWFHLTLKSHFLPNFRWSSYSITVNSAYNLQYWKGNMSSRNALFLWKRVSFTLAFKLQSWSIVNRGFNHAQQISLSSVTCLHIREQDSWK